MGHTKAGPFANGAAPALSAGTMDILDSQYDDAMADARTTIAKMPDLLITGAITRNSNEVITSAPVVWPDGTAGTYTTDSIDASNAINSYHITYGSPTVIHTYTQPTITRDSSGAATNVPQIVVS